MHVCVRESVCVCVEDCCRSDDATLVRSTRALSLSHYLALYAVHHFVDCPDAAREEEEERDSAETRNVCLKDTGEWEERGGEQTLLRDSMINILPHSTSFT